MSCIQRAVRGHNHWPPALTTAAAAHWTGNRRHVPKQAYEQRCTQQASKTNRRNAGRGKMLKAAKDVHHVSVQPVPISIACCGQRAFAIRLLGLPWCMCTERATVTRGTRQVVSPGRTLRVQRRLAGLVLRHLVHLVLLALLALAERPLRLRDVDLRRCTSAAISKRSTAAIREPVMLALPTLQ